MCTCRRGFFTRQDAPQCVYVCMCVYMREGCFLTGARIKPTWESIALHRAGKVCNCLIYIINNTLADFGNIVKYLSVTAVTVYIILIHGYKGLNSRAVAAANYYI